MLTQVKIKILAVLVIFFLLIAGTVQADVILTSSTPNGLTLTYTPEHIQFEVVSIGNVDYTKVSIDRHYIAAESGNPAIPSRRIIFASPLGAVPSVSVSGINTELKENIRIAPVPRSAPDGSGFTTDIYEENSFAYALSGFMPAAYYELGKSDNRSGLTLWELHLYPLLYDASSSALSVNNGCTISISFPSGSNSTPTGRIPEYVINRDIFLADSGLSSARKAVSLDENPFSDGEWYKIKISDTGMYKLTGANLQGAGFPENSVSVNDIHMYYGGGLMLPILPGEVSTDAFREIAITVNDIDKDGILDSFDTIIFYGQSLNRYEINETGNDLIYQNYTYMDADKAENTYWLAVHTNSDAKRIGLTGVEPDPGLEMIDVFIERFHLEKENYFDWIDDSGQEAGTDWYWESIGSETKKFSFNAPGHVIRDNQPTTLGLWFLRGLILEENYVNQIWDHTFQLALNGNEKFAINAHLKKNEIEDYSTTSQLKETNNVLDISRYSEPNGSANSHARLDWIEIEYLRKLSFQESGFEFFQAGIGTPFKFSLADASKSVIVYDTTDRYEPKRVQSFLEGTSAEFQVTIPVQSYGRYTIWDSTKYLNVASISSKTFKNLRSPSIQANHIIISHPEFLSEVKRLSAYRNSVDSDNISSIAVDVNDVYDEFSWGNYDPAAIRDYLQYVWEKSADTTTVYACLVGDTTFKYKNITEEQASLNFMPSFSASTLGSTSERTLATDDFFAWYGEFHIPEISIGRLCPVDREQARTVVDKIINYEKSPEPGPWKNRALLVADDDYGYNGARKYENFIADSETISSSEYIPIKYEQNKLYLIEYEMDKNNRKPEASKDLITAMNDGYLLVNFIGHGNNDVITHEEIFRGSRDIELINNGSRLPLYMFFSCAVGRFDRIESLSLSEMLQLRNNGGAIAVISASRLTYQTPNLNFNKSFLHYLFDNETNPQLCFGTAMMHAKRDESNDQNSYCYILLGDPASHLMTPKYSFSLAEVDTLMRLQKFDISGNITDEGTPIPFSGKLYVKAMGPDIHKAYPLSNLKVVYYSTPGKTFFNGVIDIASSNFSLSFIVPKDLPSDISNDSAYTPESHVLFYAQGESSDASGVLSGFYIGDVDPDAPEDTTAPDITMKIDGAVVQDGQRIRRQPTMTLNLTDESGINIIGNRGHNIKLTIDQSNIVILTDKFVSDKNFTSGEISYDLPLLSNGEHMFEITAFDAYNNLARKSVTVEVAGSDTGDLSIENLLNYPNPMTTEGTLFTFDLNDDARSATIKIYSQSGRLVDTVRFSAQYGFNQVQWDPSSVLANGVYFYKLSVLSMTGRKSSKIEKLVVMR